MLWVARITSPGLVCECVTAVHDSVPPEASTPQVSLSFLPQGFLWSQGSLLCPCAKEAWKNEEDTATCSNMQLMKDRILWINTPAW